MTRSFRCEPCDKSFEAKTDDYQAPACPKCQDSEGVVRAAKEIDYEDVKKFYGG